MQYDFGKIERKWQKEWVKNNYKLWAATDASANKKEYVLVMFPYPSGDGLHVGHVESYTAADIFARYSRMNKKNVLQPMGWDAFGLPAENYAIKIKTHPSKVVAANVQRFKEQLTSLGLSYDWQREVNTTDPEYYKWTQWIFLQLFKKGLAYEAEVPVNWCPKDKTVIANEEVVDGCCERCGTAVERKKLKQWILKITAYADRLLKDLDTLQWPERLKEMQRNWIGRSEGSEITFPVVRGDIKRFILLHGYKGSPKKDFFPWLEHKLKGLGYEVYAPELPNPNDPDVNEQVSFVKKNCKPDGFTVVVGHSLGGVVALRLLESGVTVNSVCLVAAPLKSEFLDKKSRPKVEAALAPGFNFKNIKSRAKQFTVLSDNNDDIIPITHGREFAAALGGALYEVPAQSPHFNTKEEPAIFNNLAVGINIFTTRPDTLAGATYMVLAPEHALVQELESRIENIEEVKTYIQKSKNKSDRERQENKEKTGIQLKGILAVNPLNNEKIPVWVADYVLMGYGTGAIMAVPQHDERDREFAQKFKLPILDRPLIDKDEVVKKVNGQKTVNYKLRDWIFSRQRYWGEPIPIIKCPACALRNPSGQGNVPVPEEDLPVKLPDVKNYEPTGDVESPLAGITKWVNVKCPRCGGAAKRETNTMPQWAGSCWYYLRYADPKNKKALVLKENEKYWLPVDLYIGGLEHAVLHFLYARFWHKFLYDIGVVSTAEPFMRVVNQGTILGPDGQKMSKSRGNVINPDAMIKEFGADSLRLYEMFMGPLEDAKPWDPRGIIGLHRFLGRVWNLAIGRKFKIETSALPAIDRVLHRTIKKVTEDIQNFHFNTAISALMILVNEMERVKDQLSDDKINQLLKLLFPFAPHIAQEIWKAVGNPGLLDYESWPTWDSRQLEEKDFDLVIQVGGKTRAVLKAAKNISQTEAENLAKSDTVVQKWLGGVSPKKVIYVPNRLINFIL